MIKYPDRDRLLAAVADVISKQAPTCQHPVDILTPVTGAMETIYEFVNALEAHNLLIVNAEDARS